jgi:hypothetical protein
MTAQARSTILADDGFADPRPTDFATAVLRRLGPRTIAAALVILAVADILGRIARIGMEKRFPVPATHSQCVLLINILFVACMTVVFVVCDEAVARGARRWSTYLLATLAACLFATWAQQQLLAWLDWDNIWKGAKFSHDWVQPLGIFSSYWLYCTMA